MVEDTPDDYIYDLFNQTIWGNDGIGQSILGRRETIKSFIRGRPCQPHKKNITGPRALLYHAREILKQTGFLMR